MDQASCRAMGIAAMNIQAGKLRKGMRFSSIPSEWHGSSIVREVRPSGHLIYVKFDNDKIVNCPGILYLEPTEKVRLLKSIK